MKKCIAYVFFFVTTLGNTQAPDTLWTRTFGGMNNDYGYSVVQTANGNYVITGRTESYGSGDYDVWLLKIDTNGVVLWTKTYGGMGYDEGRSLQQTADGGYIIAGHTDSFGFGVWLIKTDSLGDTLWAKTQVGYIGRSVQQTVDEGYIITGETEEHDVFLVKTDSLGFNQWYRIYYNVLSYDGAHSVQQTLDGGFVIVGYTMLYGTGDLDVWLLQTNALGDTLWTRTYGGSDSDQGDCVRQTFDNGYVIVGHSESFGTGEYEIYIVRTDSLGDTLWTRTYGGPESAGGLSIQPTSDSGYIVAGYTASFGAGSNDGYFIKTNSQGDSLWAKTIGGAESDIFWSAQQTSDGGYVAAGYTGSYGAGGHDVYVVKLAPDTLGIEESETGVVIDNGFTTTIFHGPLHLPKGKKCKVYDITGRVVEPTGIAPGVYFLEIDNKIVQKVIKVR